MDRTPTRTLDEMSKALTADFISIMNAEKALEKAQRLYETRTQSARTDLALAATEEEHSPAIRAAEAAAEQAAKAALTNARAVVQATTGARPILTPDEMTLAAAHRGFVADRCRDWPLRDLTEAVRQSVVTDDRAAMYCYLESLPARLASTGGDEGRSWSEPSVREKSELRGLLGDIKERLANPKLASVHESALRLVEQAGTLERAASARQRHAERHEIRFPFQRQGDVPWEQE